LFFYRRSPRKQECPTRRTRDVRDYVKKNIGMGSKNLVKKPEKYVLSDAYEDDQDDMSVSESRSVSPKSPSPPPKTNPKSKPKRTKGGETESQSSEEQSEGGRNEKKKKKKKTRVESDNENDDEITTPTKEKDTPPKRQYASPTGWTGPSHPRWRKGRWNGSTPMRYCGIPSMSNGTGLT
jgi:hypothetical protein